MKKVLITMVMGLLLAAPSYAETSLAEDTLTLAGGEKIKVAKYLDDKGVGIRLSTEAGGKIYQHENLGSEDKLFKLDDKGTKLALKDLTGDGIPEILAAAFYGPTASGLYVFSYDAAAKKIVPVKFLNSNSPDLSTECMVSDIRQEDGSDMVINADGSMTAMGMIYPKEPGDEAAPGFYTWKFADGMFKLAETKPMPVDEEEKQPE